MLGTVFNIFRVQDLRNKIIFTVALLVIYRIGFHISVPGFDYKAIAEATTQSETPLGRAAEPRLRRISTDLSQVFSATSRLFPSGLSGGYASMVRDSRRPGDIAIGRRLAAR